MEEKLGIYFYTFTLQVEMRLLEEKEKTEKNPAVFKPLDHESSALLLCYLKGFLTMGLSWPLFGLIFLCSR